MIKNNGPRSPFYIRRKRHVNARSVPRAKIEEKVCLSYIYKNFWTIFITNFPESCDREQVNFVRINFTFFFLNLKYFRKKHFHPKKSLVKKTSRVYITYTLRHQLLL